jgi:hypothetical protein
VHYIIGTQILVKPIQPGRPGDPSSYKTRQPQTKDFQPGKPYSLYHITKDREGKMRYVFISNDNSDVVGLVFDSIKAADNAISALKQEQLPDYEEIYSRNSS